MKRIAVGFLALFAFAAQAEPQYIIDKLVVNVFVEPNQEAEKVTTLDSGETVEALEKVDTYTRVRLVDGREGWIRSSYLTAQVPAAQRLKELEKQLASGATASVQPDPQVAQELKQVKEQNAALQSEVAALKQAAAQSAQSPAQTAARVSAAVEPVGQLQGPQPPAESTSMPTGMWAVPAIVLAAGSLGFFLGYQALARRIRRKYGSVKIY
jgi:uncharacterized protein YgiM (DUF1202 family)